MAAASDGGARGGYGPAGRHKDGVMEREELEEVGGRREGLSIIHQAGGQRGGGRESSAPRRWWWAGFRD